MLLERARVSSGARERHHFLFMISPGAATLNIPRLSPFRIQRQLKEDDKLWEKMKMFINKNQMSFFHLPEIYGAGVSSGSGTRMIQIFKFTKIIVSILKEMTWRILKSNLRSPSKFRNNFD